MKIRKIALWKVKDNFSFKQHFSEIGELDVYFFRSSLNVSIFLECCFSPLTKLTSVVTNVPVEQLVVHLACWQQVRLFMEIRPALPLTALWCLGLS